MVMDFETFEKRLLSDLQFKQEVDKYDLKRDISRKIIEARVIKGLTQEKLAELIKSSQATIARLENGSRFPSLTFLNRIAQALGSRLIVTFDFLLQEDATRASNSHNRMVLRNSYSRLERRTLARVDAKSTFSIERGGHAI